MTTLSPAPAPAPSPAPPSPGAVRSAPEQAACLRWSWRLVRRGALIMWLAVATYMAVEVLTFRSAYPDEASREKLRDLSSSTAVRMLQGVPSAVDTAGGFAVWDGTWMVTLIVACWALLAATKLTRGEEDTGRAELVLSRPTTARGLLAANLAALAVGVAGIAVAAALPFVVFGEPVGGALLWGAGLGLFGAVMAALGVLGAQLLEPRRRAVSLGLGLMTAAFLLRVVANSADGRVWLLAATPFGWLDRLRPFGDNRWGLLTVPLVAALLLGAAALALCSARDAGAALRGSSGVARSRLRLLGGAGAFGWRLTSGALLAWTVMLSVTALVFGLMVGAIVDFIEEDDTYRRMLESMGMDMSVPVVGFLSYTAAFLALPFAAFVGWRLGAVRQEEADGRLDNLLTCGVVRWRWLAVATLQAFGAATILVAAGGASLWAGAQLADTGVTVPQVVEPIAGTLPLVALFTGAAVLIFGLAPRLTIALPVTLPVLGYLLETFGTMLDWPRPLLALSPFHHLARLPSAPMTVTAAAVMGAVGVAAAAAGIVAFARRDLRGA